MAERFDVTILGAGPVGMFAAFYAGFRNLRTKIIDSLEEVGGQITALYPDKAITDVAGFPSVPGKELVEQLRLQMDRFKPTLALGEQALTLKKLPDGAWRIGTDKGEHETRGIIIASGIGLFTPRRFNRPQVDLWEGRGLEFVMKNPEQYAGKRVLIVGGGDSAVDWALHLAPIAEKIYVAHRRHDFRAHEANVEDMCRDCEVIAPGQVRDARGDEQIKEVVLARGAGEEDLTLEIDAVLAFLGFMSDAGAMVDWGLTLHKNQIVINQRSETNLPGIYAAGDCAWFEGKAKLIAVGFGEAATAVNNLAVFLDPSKSVFPGHSTNM